MSTPAANLWPVASSNAFNTTANGNIGVSDVTITLTTVTGLSTSGGVLVIDRVDASGNATPTKREYIAYTGISSSTITGCIRGIGGSTAQAHSSNAVIEEVFSITHWNDLITAVKNVLTSAGVLDVTKVVDLTTAQTLTNKLLTSPTVTTPTVTTPTITTEFSNGTQGGTYNIDWSKGDRQNVTISSNITFTFSNAVAGQTLTLWLIENVTGGFSITFPSLKWPSNGSATTWTTTTNAVNAIVIRYNGTNYYAQGAANFS